MYSLLRRTQLETSNHGIEPKTPNPDIEPIGMLEKDYLQNNQCRRC